MASVVALAITSKVKTIPFVSLAKICFFNLYTNIL